MRFKYEIEINVERQQGKFASREEIAEQLQDALEGADPGNIDASEGGEYVVNEWSVNEVDESKTKSRKLPGRVVEKNSATDPTLIVGSCAGCGLTDLVLSEVSRNRWRCKTCAMPQPKTARTTGADGPWHER